MTIGRLVNAFFRWEFNSCETLIKDGVVYPIDYANACPDVSLTSLHYYFPWAIKALVSWSVFCTATGRRPRYDLDTRRYFDVADRTDLDYGEKLARYRALADDYFDVERYADFCASRLAHLDEVVARLGGRARTLTGCSSRPCAPRSHRMSTTSSSTTIGACWRLGPRSAGQPSRALS